MSNERIDVRTANLTGVRTAHLAAGLFMAWMFCGCDSHPAVTLPGPGLDGGTGECFECAPNCFDCGTGCFCSDTLNEEPWVSVFPATGDNGGWRSDKPVFCPPTGALDAIDLWSDARGVYVIVSGQSVLGENDSADDKDVALPAGAGGGGGFGGVGGVGGTGTGGVGGTGSPPRCTSSRCMGEAIYFSDGESGWQRIHERRENTSRGGRRLSGVPGGALISYSVAGADSFPDLCGLGRLEGTQWTCDRQGVDVGGVNGAGPDRAFATLGMSVVSFDGVDWSVVEPAASDTLRGVWANESALFTVDVVGNAMRLAGDSWQRHAADRLVMNVWGSGSDDVWLTDVAGAVWRLDDSATDLVVTAPRADCGEGDPTVHVWGTADALFLYSERTLHRWNGTTLERLGDWSCERRGVRLTRVWGNNPTEVFLAFEDVERGFTHVCGSAVVVFFDGTTFHQL